MRARERSKKTEDDTANLADKLKDAIWFIESCLFIVDKDSKKVPFLLNAAQKLYNKARTARDIILKARKMGFSTFIIALFLHACITRENTYAVLVSHDKESTQRLFRRLKYMIENCIIPIRVKIKEDSVEFIDTNSVFWIGTAGSKKFGRGDDVTHVHFSEAAFYESWDVITGLSEALTNDSVVVFESTANGAGTQFHKFWNKTVGGENAYSGHFYPWFTDPNYSVPGGPKFEKDEEERSLAEMFDLGYDKLQWRRNKLGTMPDPDLFPQEYPSTPEEAFLTSGKMVFAWKAIKMMEGAIYDPKWVGTVEDKGDSVSVIPSKDGPYSVWKRHDDRLLYLITADAAEGIPGLDYSVADVWDTRTWEQVAQWRGYKDPLKFAETLKMIGVLYGWACIACEDNFPGNAVNLKLKELKYPNLWRSPDARPGDVGFTTTSKTRSVFISDGREAVRDLDIKVNSKYTLAELKTFVLNENGKMEAQSGCHDDTVITLCAGAFILKRWTLDSEVKKKAFGSILARRKRVRYGGHAKKSPGRNKIV